jgi:putative transposase
MDFLSDQLFDSCKIRVLTIVDAFSKVSPAIDVRPRYTGSDVVARLDRVTAEYDIPNSIRVDNPPRPLLRNSLPGDGPRVHLKGS